MPPQMRFIIMSLKKSTHTGSNASLLPSFPKTFRATAFTTVLAPTFATTNETPRVAVETEWITAPLPRWHSQRRNKV